MDAYRADSESERPSLNASVAKILLAQSPLHAWLAHPRLNPLYVEDHDRAFDLGTAAHALMFGGKDLLCIIDADDYRTKAAKEARDAAINDGKLPLLTKQANILYAMVPKAIKAWSENSDLHGYIIADGDAEKEIRWSAKDAQLYGKTFPDFPMRGKPDWVSGDKRLIVDYKTTGGTAHPDKWLTGALKDQGADIQAAMYLWACRALGGPEDARFVFLVQETDAPYCCSFVGVSPMTADLGASKLSQAVQLWIDCLTADKWPGYPSRIVYPDPPAWAFKEMEAA